MKFWNNNDHRSFLNDAEDLAYQPAYSPWTKWFCGCLLAGLLAGYSILAWIRGSITLFGRGNSLEITGDDVALLAGAYLAFAAFIHFHCFWNLHPPLARFTQPLKVTALLIFLPCLCLVIYHQIGL